jgi:hypothetical protein
LSLPCLTATGCKYFFHSEVSLLLLFTCSFSVATTWHYWAVAVVPVGPAGIDKTRRCGFADAVMLCDRSVQQFHFIFDAVVSVGVAVPFGSIFWPSFSGHLGA